MNETIENQQNPEKASFLSRWRAGIAQISPLQALQAQQKANWVMCIGLIAGIIATAFKLSDFWWIEIILAAGLFNQVFTVVGTQQKIKMLKNIEESMKGGM